MAIRLHTPPTYGEILHGQAVVFLAGPIQGAPDWHADAIDFFNDRYEGKAPLHIANPRVYTFDKTNFVKKDQIRWEKAHLLKARDYGAMIFWLAAESEDAPVPNKPGRAYGQTTRLEFGRAVGWHDLNPDGVNICLGMEPGYVGSEDYYRDNADEIGIPVHTSLDQTCLTALDKIMRLHYGAV